MALETKKITETLNSHSRSLIDY